MLSKEHWLAEYDYSRNQVFPDRLTRSAHSAYLDHARRLIRCYQDGIGQSRQQLHHQVEDILEDEPDCPSRRRSAFCGILDAQSRFAEGQDVDAARLRKTVFRMAANHHPLVEQSPGLFASDSKSVRYTIAQSLDRSWDEIESDLFADVHECQRLREYQGVSEPEQLLALYNVAQTQMTLVEADHVFITTDKQPERLVECIRQLSLMHEVTVDHSSLYGIKIERPRQKRSANQAYSTAISQLLVLLFSHDNWQLDASIPVRTKRGRLRFILKHDDGLNCSVTPPMNRVPSYSELLWEQWRLKPEEGWELRRVCETIRVDHEVVLSDYQLIANTDRMIHLEVLSGWSKSLLQRRLDTIRRLTQQTWILALPRFSKNDRQQFEIPAHCKLIGFKTRPSIADILELCNQFGDGSSNPNSA